MDKIKIPKQCLINVKNELNDAQDEISSLRRNRMVKTSNIKVSTLKKSKFCEETYEKNFELETHLNKTHDGIEKFDCKKCGKYFALKWRLDKHLINHEIKNRIEGHVH